jgi:hypothetical protein
MSTHLNKLKNVFEHQKITCMTKIFLPFKERKTNTVTKVVFDFSYLKVARGDSLNFEILGGVAGQLQHLRRQILQNCRAEQENISNSSKTWLCYFSLFLRYSN